MRIKSLLKWTSDEFELHILFSEPIDVEAEHFVILPTLAACLIVVKEKKKNRETTGGV